MIPILKFTRGETGREVVQLGAVTIGEVAPHRGVHARATYALWLPDVRHSFVPAESMARARAAVEHVVEEFLLRIGVFYPGQCLEIRIEGEGPDPDEVPSIEERLMRGLRGPHVMFVERGAR
jgi:hypothetical protein